MHDHAVKFHHNLPGENHDPVAAIKHPETNERLSKEGADPVGNSPHEFGKFIQSEIEKWRKVIWTAGIEPS